MLILFMKILHQQQIQEPPCLSCLSSLYQEKLFFNFIIIIIDIILLWVNNFLYLKWISSNPIHSILISDEDLGILQILFYVCLGCTYGMKFRTVESPTPWSYKSQQDATANQKLKPYKSHLLKSIVKFTLKSIVAPLTIHDVSS